MVNKGTLFLGSLLFFGAGHYSWRIWQAKYVQVPVDWFTDPVFHYDTDPLLFSGYLLFQVFTSLLGLIFIYLAFNDD